MTTKNKTTGDVSEIPCPACGATLNLTALNLKLKGDRFTCHLCSKVLVTVGGVTALITDEPISSRSLVVDDDQSKSDTLPKSA